MKLRRIFLSFLSSRNLPHKPRMCAASLAQNDSSFATLARSRALGVTLTHRRRIQKVGVGAQPKGANVSLCTRGRWCRR